MNTPTTPQAPLYRCEVTVDEATLPTLRLMGADGRLSSDHIFVHDGRARMVLTQPEIDLLRGMGLQVQVGPDLRQQARAVQVESLPPADVTEATGLRTGFVFEYMDATAIYQRFQSLHDEFPDLTEWSDLPHPTHGYDGSRMDLAGPAPVKLFRIGTALASRSRPGMLLIAGTHAREWIPPLAALEFAEQLLRNFQPGSSDPAVQQINRLLEGLDLLIVPACNPDGIHFSHHDDAMWRKNRRSRPPTTPAGCDGVDNNRNYSVYWGEPGSSPQACSDAYRGPEALSEPENRNVVALLEQFPNILTAVDCHSFGEDIFRPQPTGGLAIPSQPVAPPDHAIYLALEAAMNAAIGSVSPGKSYDTGTTNNHAGTLDDYLFLAHRIFGFTLECGQDFQPPIAEALHVVREVVAALLALATETLSLAQRFVSPVSLVQVIDASDAAAAGGLGETVRASGRRMIDVISLNDSVGVVSYAAVATTHLPLTRVSGPGEYARCREAVDAVTFGGSSALGAGLRAAAGLLAGVAGPHAVVLLSDGIEDHPPAALEVLAELPQGTPVHVIPLTEQADLALLREIAEQTGGRLHSRRDPLGLIEIYNAIRAGASGEEVLLSERLTFRGADTEAAGEPALQRTVTMPEDAAYALFTLAWNDPEATLRLRLQPSDGAEGDSTRMRTTRDATSQSVRLRRPRAGAWSLQLDGRSAGRPLDCILAVSIRRSL
jgi:Zinc carboxypeptidase/von Willebrand factor type A domain